MAVLTTCTSACKAALIALAALVAVATISPGALAGSPRIDELRRTLERFDRQLCNRFQKLTCSRRTTKPRSPEKQPSAAKQASSTVRDEEDPPPKPVMKKPNPLATKVVANTVKQPKRPIPVMKPANLAAGNQGALARNSKAAPQVASAKKAAATSAAPAEDVQQADPAKKPVQTVLLPKTVTTAPLANPMPDGVLSGAACFNTLVRMGVDFDSWPTPVSAGSCSVAEPVKLKSIPAAGQHVILPDQPLLTCGFAARLTSWLIEKAQPAVHEATGSRIKSMGTGPGYECRRRNGDSTSKFSEHAFGNAVDIEYLKLADGQVIKVQDAGDNSSRYRSVLAALRGSGCEYFTTVLGPGSNSAHESHFHFDLERRGKKGNHTLCQ